MGAKELMLATPPHDFLRFAEVDLGVLFCNLRRAVAENNSRNIEPEFLAEPSCSVVPKLVRMPARNLGLIASRDDRATVGLRLVYFTWQLLRPRLDVVSWSMAA